MKANSIYTYESGIEENGDVKYYLIFTHEFNEKALNAIHIVKIIQYSKLVDFYVPFEINPGSPIWKDSVEVDTEQFKRIVVQEVFDLASIRWR